MAGTFARHLALIGFATVCSLGLLSNSPFEACLKAALLAALIFFPLGWILGELARWLVEEQVQLEVQQRILIAASEKKNNPENKPNPAPQS